MKRYLRRFIHGQKGFTLIELLVVVAILGVLAAVIVPNVVRFMGQGAVEAANTEAHNVQTAVIAHMADKHLLDFDGDVGPDTNSGPEAFLASPGGLQAVYTIVDGLIDSADITSISNSKWTGLTYTKGTGWAKTP